MLVNSVTYSVEYAALRNAIHRCHNPKQKQYKDYGGRGIYVCDRWRNSFVDFINDVGPKPSPELTLDRLDNNKGYEPGNVAWRNRKEQASNRRSAKAALITINGVSRSAAEWSKVSGIHPATIRSRVNRLGLTGIAVIAPVVR